MKTFRHFLTDLLLVAGGIGGAIVLLVVGLYVAGFPAHVLVVEWIKGAVGTRGDVLVALKNACPLILTGLAAGVAFRSGVFNIGAEGQSIAGSIVAVTLATRIAPGLPAWAAIPALLTVAAVGGAMWGAIAAGLDRWRGVPVVLSTILLNFVALHVLSLLLEGPLKTAGTQVIQSDALPSAYTLPVIFAAPGGYVHAGFPIALGIAAVCWVIQARTTYGFEILVTGLNPVAAQYAGMPVAARQFGIMLWSGAFAGLSGAIQLMGVEGGHFLGTNPSSYGYAGIAVALLGRLHPAGIVLAAVFFALLDRGATNIEFAHFPLELSDIVKALIVLIVLVGTVQVARRRMRVGGTSGGDKE